MVLGFKFCRLSPQVLGGNFQSAVVFTKGGTGKSGPGSYRDWMSGIANRTYSSGMKNIRKVRLHRTPGDFQPDIFSTPWRIQSNPQPLTHSHQEPETRNQELYVDSPLTTHADSSQKKIFQCLQEQCRLFNMQPVPCVRNGYKISKRKEFLNFRYISIEDIG